MVPPKFHPKEKSAGSRLEIPPEERDLHSSLTFDIKGQISDTNKYLKLSTPRPYLAKFVTIQFVKMPRAQQADNQYYIALQKLGLKFTTANLSTQTTVGNFLSRKIAKILDLDRNEMNEEKSVLQLVSSSIKLTKKKIFDLEAIVSSQTSNLEALISAQNFSINHLVEFLERNQILKTRREITPLLLNSNSFNLIQFVESLRNFGTMGEAETGVLIAGLIKVLNAALTLTMQGIEEFKKEEFINNVENELNLIKTANPGVFRYLQFSSQSLPSDFYQNLVEFQEDEIFETNYITKLRVFVKRLKRTVINTQYSILDDLTIIAASILIYNNRPN